MKIINTYPKEAIKLYHRKAGEVIQLCNNDGSVDSNIYMVTREQNEQSTTLVNLSNGSLNKCSVSNRTILIKDVAVIIGYLGEGE